MSQLPYQSYQEEQCTRASPFLSQKLISSVRSLSPRLIDASTMRTPATAGVGLDQFVHGFSPRATTPATSFLTQIAPMHHGWQSTAPTYGVNDIDHFSFHQFGAYQGINTNFPTLDSLASDMFHGVGVDIIQGDEVDIIDDDDIGRLNDENTPYLNAYLSSPLEATKHSADIPLGWYYNNATFPGGTDKEQYPSGHQQLATPPNDPSVSEDEDYNTFTETPQSIQSEGIRNPGSENVEVFERGRGVSILRTINRKTGSMSAVGLVVKISLESLIGPEHVLGYKLKKANPIVLAQKRRVDVAKRMGQDVKITYSESGVHIGGTFWKPPANDRTIPATQGEINKHVEELVAAILHNDNTREKRTTKQFQNRWADDATHYTRDEMRVAAQEVIYTMTDIHRNGWTKVITDRDQRALFQKTMFFTFEDRLNRVVELLTSSKTTCADLMKGERLYAIIGNPCALLGRTASNSVSNKKKAQRIEAGTEVEKSLKRTHKEMEGDEGKAPAAPRPIKKARNTRSKARSQTHSG